MLDLIYGHFYYDWYEMNTKTLSNFCTIFARKRGVDTQTRGLSKGYLLQFHTSYTADARGAGNKIQSSTVRGSANAYLSLFLSFNYSIIYLQFCG